MTRNHQETEGRLIAALYRVKRPNYVGTSAARICRRNPAGWSSERQKKNQGHCYDVVRLVEDQGFLGEEAARLIERARDFVVEHGITEWN